MPDPTPDPKQAAALAELETSREAARLNDPYHYVRPEHELSERERLAEFAMAEYAKTPDGIREAELAQHRAAWKQDVANKAVEITATLKAQADQIAADAKEIAALQAQLAQIAADTKPATKDAGKVKTGGGMLQF